MSLNLDTRVTGILGANDHRKTNLLEALTHLNADQPFTEDHLNWDCSTEPSKSLSVAFHFELNVDEQSSLQLRDELLDREIFYTLTEATILIERWRRQYNTVRPHRALGYRPPAPETVMPAPKGGLIMSPALS